MFLKKLSTLALITLFSVASVNAADIIYKWKDKSGNIKYTETRPAAGISYKIIKNRTTRDARQDNATANKSTSTTERKSRKADKKSAKSDPITSAKEAKAKNCEIAKKNLETLKNSKKIQVAGEDGEKRVISDKERESHLEQTKKNIEEFCK